MSSVDMIALHHIARHCTTLQHTATHCNTHSMSSVDMIAIQENSGGVGEGGGGWRLSANKIQGRGVGVGRERVTGVEGEEELL